MRFTRGFTIIELMVTIAVLAIVVSIAAPSFSNILRENRTVAMTNELQGAIQLARSEAVKRRSNVVICRRNTAGDACDNSADWAAGWLILSGTTVIKVWDAVTGLVVAGPNTGLTFKSNGMVTAVTNFSVNTPSCTGPQKRTLSVTLIGTTTLAKADC